MEWLPKSERLPFQPPVEDFSYFAKQPFSFFLDSSSDLQNGGRYSFWGMAPLLRWESEEGFVTINGHKQIDSPFDSLKALYKKILPLPVDPYFPFCGGLVGYFGYEWGVQQENIEASPSLDLVTPDASLGLYDTIVGYDLLEKSCRVISLGLNENLEPDPDLAAERIAHLAEQIQKKRKMPLSSSSPNGFASPSIPHWSSVFSREEYLAAVEKILNYLKAGDCYQVNLTQRLVAPTSQNPWNLYQRLRTISPSPYAAFLNLDSFQILSSSPECFLQANREGRLLTKPIKGTRKRGKGNLEDETLKEELKTSHKDHAELLMITDLERNDLGKISVPGSVVVPKLRALESYAQVHHLVSTVVGQRKTEIDIIDCLKAMLPGGSITGAPKVRAMEIINELEPVRRGVYTGTIGWIGPANTTHLNIAIRTILLQHGKAYFHAGGGVVIDSDPKTEYEESLAKAKGMMEALGL